MSWLQRLFARKRMENDLDRELRFHFESQVADKMRSGTTESEKTAEKARHRCQYFHFHAGSQCS